jgi:hypothetical protein
MPARTREASHGPPLSRARRCGEPLWRRALPPLACRLRTLRLRAVRCAARFRLAKPLRVKRGDRSPLGRCPGEAIGRHRQRWPGCGAPCPQRARRRTAAREKTAKLLVGVRRDRRPDQWPSQRKAIKRAAERNIALTARPPTRRFLWVVVRIAQNAGFGHSDVYGLYAHGRVKEAYDGLCETRFPRQSLPVSRASR